MNRTKLLLVCAVAFGALIGAQVATATTLQKLTLQDLAKQSVGIALAHVEDAVSRWDDDHREIYTYVTLRVTEPVKGMTGGETVTIRQIGGEVGSIASIVPGTASFRNQEEVVVFLTERDRSGYASVLGWQQGKYSVRTDARGMKFVRNDMDRARVVSPDGSVQEGFRSSKEMPLGAFIAHIKTALDQPGRFETLPKEIE